MASENTIPETRAPEIQKSFLTAPFQDSPEIQNPISAAMDAAAHSSEQAMTQAPTPPAPSASGSRKPGSSSGKTVAILIVLVGLIFGVGVASFFLPKLVRNVDDTLRQQVKVNSAEVWPGDARQPGISPPASAINPTSAKTPDSLQKNGQPPRPRARPVPMTQN